MERGLPNWHLPPIHNKGVAITTPANNLTPPNWVDILPNPWKVICTENPAFVCMKNLYAHIRRTFGEKMRDKRRRGIFLTRRGK